MRMWGYRDLTVWSEVGKAERTQAKAESTRGTKGNYLRQLPENNPVINIPPEFLLWRNFIIVGELLRMAAPEVIPQ